MLGLIKITGLLKLGIVVLFCASEAINVDLFSTFLSISPSAFADHSMMGILVDNGQRKYLATKRQCKSNAEESARHLPFLCLITIEVLPILLHVMLCVHTRKNTLARTSSHLDRTPRHKRESTTMRRILPCSSW